MMRDRSVSPEATLTESGRVDHYQLLTNHCPIGPLVEIQIPRLSVTSVHGIMFDLDPDKINASRYPAAVEGPHAFYEKTLRHWLDNDPVLKKAEVRMSGTGLHVVLWLEEPVELRNGSDQQRWDCIIAVVQCCLPIDPGQPSITGGTRAIGSINSKNGALVEQLTPGGKVSQCEIEDLYTRMVKERFGTICRILFGSDKVPTCPICEEEGTSLQAVGSTGRCYKCKSVSLEQLLATVYTPNIPGGSK